MVEPRQKNNAATLRYNGVLNGILQKLNQILEDELVALNKTEHVSLEEFARKKISLFSQLRVLENQHHNTEISNENVEIVKELKECLCANMQKLELQMNAMKELNSTIEKAVISDQSDGTYTICDNAMRGNV